MMVEKFWVVKNPTELSEMVDICWETDVDTFARYVLGTADGEGPSRFEQENHQVHTSECTARAEAQSRLKVRDEILKVLALKAVSR